MITRLLPIALAILVTHSSSTAAQGGVTHYCSSGLAGSHISASGSSSFTINGGSGDLVLHADNVGPNAPGLFIMGSSAIAPVPFGNGFRCVGGAVLRFQPTLSSPGSNTRTLALDYTSSGPAGMITPGSAWNFQFWFRSAGSFDLSDALRIDFVPPGVVPSVTTVAQGTSSGHPLSWDLAGGILLVDDAAEWATLWSQHAGGTPPAIDFGQDIVVAAFAGRRSTGGYSLAISNISQSVSTLYVDSVEQAPGPGCLVTLAITQPFHFVRVPRVQHAEIGAWNRAVNVYLCP